MGSGWVVDGYRPIDKKALAALNSGKFDNHDCIVNFTRFVCQLNA